MIAAPARLPLAHNGKPYHLDMDERRPVMQRYEFVPVAYCSKKMWKVYYVRVVNPNFATAARKLYGHSDNGTVVEYFTDEEFKQLRNLGVLVQRNELTARSRVLRG